MIAYLSADDMYEPGAIRHAVEGLSVYPEAIMVYSDCNLIDEQGQIIGTFPANAFSGNDLFLGNYIPQQTVFLRREMLESVGTLNADLHLVMDFEW